MLPAFTVLMPWHGRDKELFDQARHSLPRAPLLVALNDGTKQDMAVAMSAALDAVETPWVLRMDADDLASPTMVERLFAGCGSADGAYPALQSFGALTHLNDAEPFSKHRIQDENCVPGPILIRTEALRAVGGWRAHPMEDWDLAWRLADAGFLLVPVPSAVYHYRRRASGTNNAVGACLRDGDFTMDDILGVTTGGRGAWPACFYVSATQGISYVRGLLMAEHMPAPVRLNRNVAAHEYETGVWHHATSLEEPYIAEDRKRGRRVVIDVDDNYLSTHLIHTLRHQTRWSPGLKATADQWQKLLPSHRRIAMAADGVVCATPALAEEYAKVNGHVRVVRNAVEPLHWRQFRSVEAASAGLSANASGPEGAFPNSGRGCDSHRAPTLRVGWAAAAQHGPDAELVEPALRWAASQPGVEVVMVGLDPNWDFDYTHVEQTRSVHAYRDILQTFDVGVCPLQKGGINHFKSDLKWLEYSMGGAAVVVSDMEPYATVRDGITGLKARTKADFLDHIKTLVEDEDVREGLVRQARDEILATRTSELAGAEYLAAIEVRQAVAA